MATLSELRSTILRNFPQSVHSALLPFVDNVLGLPGLEVLKPNNIDPAKAIDLVFTGFSLSYLAGNGSIKPIIKKFIKETLRVGGPSQGDLAEIRAAALCAATGASEIEHIKPGQPKTPDFIVSWDKRTKIQMEVTCAQKKRKHKLVREGAQKLGQQIHELDLKHDIEVFVSDFSDLEQFSEVIKAAELAEPGREKSSAVKWVVKAKDITRSPNTLLVAGQKSTPPAWWPKNALTQIENNFIQWVASKDASNVPPQVRVNYSVPVDAYINTVKHKADRPQVDKEHPFLIALDVENLSDAFGEFRRILPLEFKHWDHVREVDPKNRTVV
jgi:hypothetical protein